MTTNNVKEWKSAQSRCKHCALAAVGPSQKFFCPTADPLPRVWDGQNLISWRWSLPLPTNPVWWGSMHGISSYRGNRPTRTHTHPPTDRSDYNTLQLAHSVINVKMHYLILQHLHGNIWISLFCIKALKTSLSSWADHDYDRYLHITRMEYESTLHITRKWCIYS